MGEVKGFFSKYRGAIIGFVIALLLIIFELDRVILGIVILVIGAVVGNYVQKNKEFVKETLKNLIDKM